MINNVFVKPNADKLACMLRRENGTLKRNVFAKRRDRMGATWPPPNADKLACMLRRENDTLKRNKLIR